MPELNPLSPAEQATLKTELALPAYSALADEQRMNALSAPTQVANPNSQQQVPVPFSAAAIMSLLSAASLGNFVKLPVAPVVVDALNANDVTHSLQWCAAALISGTITQAEHDAVAARIQQTQADPNWQATVPGPRRTVQLFAAKVWTVANTDNGSTYQIDHPPLVAVTEAR